MKRESDTTINTQNDKDIPETNYQEFKKVIDSRRSVRVFKEDPVPDDVIKKALNDGFKAPNSSNLQPWKFIWVKSENKRERLSKLCFSQRGAKTAQHLIICVAQTNTWKKNCKKILEVMKSSDKKVPNIVENYYKKIAPASYGFIGPFGVLSPFKWLLITMIGFFREIPRTPIWPSDLVTWAVKSTALACENIILGF